MLHSQRFYLIKQVFLRFTVKHAQFNVYDSVMQPQGEGVGGFSHISLSQTIPYDTASPRIYLKYVYINLAVHCYLFEQICPHNRFWLIFASILKSLCGFGMCEDAYTKFVSKIKLHQNVQYQGGRDGMCECKGGRGCKKIEKHCIK